MKQICTQLAFVSVLLVSTNAFSQTVTENFESQAEVNTLLSNCWTFNNVGFNNSSVISGSGSVVTTLGSASELITPELLIPPSLTINFSYNTIATAVGSKTLKIFLVIDGVETILESINLNSTASGNFSATYTSANTPGSNINGSRKVIFRTTDNASVVIDNLSINAPYTFFGGCGTSNITLPVKFSGFLAKKIHGGVSLSWTVGMEQNVKGYEVQKSIDGNKFSRIGFVPANAQSSYSFADNKVSETAFYRIKSVDNDGTYMYSIIVSLKGQQSTTVMKAFPMPVQNQLTIQHNSATNNSKIELVSADGRIIKSLSLTSGTQQTSLDLCSAKAGVYIIRFINETSVESLKLVKQ